jgi:mono/diheme cytochrome c family protein
MVKSAVRKNLYLISFTDLTIRGIRIILLLTSWFLFPERVNAQEWTVPPDRAKVLSPFPFTDETKKAGETIFMTNCKSCHGDPGKGNFIALNPPPPDPAQEKMQRNRDGELLYKIREGHGAMPPFKNTLPGTSIWNVISYIRSFNPNYKQQVSSVAAAEGTAKIGLQWLKDENKIKLTVTNEINKVVKPLAGEEVQLSAIRYFGSLPLDKLQTTDNEGTAVFSYPTDLKGDSLGNIRLDARLADETKHGEVKADTLLKIGVATWKPPLNKDRSMWNIVQKAPLWLLISYITIVLAIWGFSSRK